MTKEELVNELKRAIKSPTPADKQVACGMAVRWLEKNTDKDPQELDEAAEEYAKNEAYGMNDDLIRICNDVFKAGAKWMAEQGVSFSYEVFLDDDYKLPYIELDTGSVQGTQWLDKHEYKKGNKVIVQIRKAD